MVHDRPNWLMKTRRAALILSAVFLPLMAFAASAVHAQSLMRTPNLNVGARTPTINPTITPRINPTIAAYGQLKPDSLPLAEIAKHKKAASALVDKVGFDN